VWIDGEVSVPEELAVGERGFFLEKLFPA